MVAERPNNPSTPYDLVRAVPELRESLSNVHADAPCGRQAQ